MPSKHFLNLMEECKAVHLKKNADYATDDNPFSNFERAAELVSWFTNPIDQTFAGIIGIKLARIAELCNGKIPKNESLDDSLLDLTNYAGLWCAHRRSLVESSVILKIEKVNNIPHLCSFCSPLSSIGNQINHATDTHGAKYNKAQHTLTFDINGEKIVCVL